jgi:hypothetical protein
LFRYELCLPTTLLDPFGFNVHVDSIDFADKGESVGKGPPLGWLFGPDNFAYAFKVTVRFHCKGNDVPKLPLISQDVFAILAIRPAKGSDEAYVAAVKPPKGRPVPSRGGEGAQLAHLWAEAEDISTLPYIEDAPDTLQGRWVESNAREGWVKYEDAPGWAGKRYAEDSSLPAKDDKGTSIIHGVAIKVVARGIGPGEGAIAKPFWFQQQGRSTGAVWVSTAEKGGVSTAVDVTP